MLPAAIFGLGPLELIIIIAVIVVLFLPALLPKMAKRLGETMVTLKDMANKELDQDDEDTDGTKAKKEPKEPTRSKE